MGSRNQLAMWALISDKTRQSNGGIRFNERILGRYGAIEIVLL